MENLLQKPPHEAGSVEPEDNAKAQRKNQALGAHKPLDNQQQPKTATVTTDGYSSLPTNSSGQHTRHIETAPLETKTQ